MFYYLTLSLVLHTVATLPGTLLRIRQVIGVSLIGFGRSVNTGMRVHVFQTQGLDC